MLGGCECSGTGCNELERRIDRVITGEEWDNGNVGVFRDIWVCGCKDISVSCEKIITSILARWMFVIVATPHSRRLVDVNVSENKIGEGGATALVECLKEMRNTKELYLGGES